MTTTLLNDLPAQDLRYRVAAHLDLGDDQRRPRTTPQRPDHDATGTGSGASRFLGRRTRLSRGDQTPPVTPSNCLRPHGDDQRSRSKVRPDAALQGVLAASLHSAIDALEYLTTVGDRSRAGEPTPESGRR